MLLVCLAGCANQGVSPAAAPGPSPSAGLDLPTPSPSAGLDLPTPSAAPGDETISGTVVAGVEPNCLLLQDSAGSHLLIFHDPSLRKDATAGSKVTVTGKSEPKQMSTCQQGIPFIVSAVQPG